MKTKIAWLSGAAAGALMLAGCGGGADDGCCRNNGGSTTPGSPPSVLNTQAVLSIAKKPSETAQPFAVDGGAVTVYPTDDQTSEPISVDATT